MLFQKKEPKTDVIRIIRRINYYCRNAFDNVTSLILKMHCLKRLCFGIIQQYRDKGQNPSLLDSYFRFCNILSFILLSDGLDSPS